MSQNKPTVEEKIQQLEAQVAWFDSDEFTIEQALAQYQAAQKLATEITDELEQLTNEITIVNQAAS